MIEYNVEQCPSCGSLETDKGSTENDRFCRRCGGYYNSRVEYQKALLEEEERQQFVTDRD